MMKKFLKNLIEEHKNLKVRLGELRGKIEDKLKVKDKIIVINADGISFQEANFVKKVDIDWDTFEKIVDWLKEKGAIE